MRSAVVLAVLALALVWPRVAAACFEPLYEQHVLDRSQLSDTVKPGPVAVSMWIETAQSGGCAAPTAERCGAPDGARLVLAISASDDQTPPDRMGFRITVSAGRAPFAEPGDVRPIGDLVQLPLGDATGYDFELAIRAIDLNGNLGPATYTQISDAAAADGGCASHGGGSALSLGLVALALARVLRRR